MNYVRTYYGDMTQSLFNSSQMYCLSAQISLWRAVGEENGTVHIIIHSSVFVLSVHISEHQHN